MARAIQASLEEARAQQQRQQQQQAAAAGKGGLAGTSANPDRPSDAEIIEYENQIRCGAGLGGVDGVAGCAAVLLCRGRRRHAPGSIAPPRPWCCTMPGWPPPTVCPRVRMSALPAREAEVQRTPLMGDREPLDALAAEYAAGAAIYRQKIGALGEEYGSIRWAAAGSVACLASLVAAPPRSCWQMSPFRARRSAHGGMIQRPALQAFHLCAPLHTHQPAPHHPGWLAPRRRTRGDGNCFFRSFLFGYLEHLLLSGDVAERDRLLGRLAALKKELVEVGGYDDIGGRRPGVIHRLAAARLPGLPASQPTFQMCCPHTPLPVPDHRRVQCWRRRWMWCWRWCGGWRRRSTR
jgi:hypothetical protein